MENQEKSSSMEQQIAKKIIFQKVNEWLGIELMEKEKILVGETFMQPDFYSKSERVIGQIFTHIGKTNRGQDNRIANDILKMLLLEKLEGKTYRKIIVVCDENKKKELLNGKTILAQCINQFNIEVEIINIENELRDTLLIAQKRQRR